VVAILSEIDDIKTIEREWIIHPGNGEKK